MSRKVYQFRELSKQAKAYAAKQYKKYLKLKNTDTRKVVSILENQHFDFYRNGRLAASSK